MSKVLSVENGNYIIKVEQGQNIILDTSRSSDNLSGYVIVNGGLQVKGETTTVTSVNTEIEDNILVVNKYITDNPPEGIFDGEAGLEVDRGTASDVRIVYDESINSLGAQTVDGMWSFRRSNTTLPQPIYIGGIKCNGTLFIDVNSQVISVSGNTAYEKNVFRYHPLGYLEADAQGSVTIDDDHIPNAKAVRDYVTWAFTNTGSGKKLNTFDTSIELFDYQLDQELSRIEFKVDDTLKSTFFIDKVEIENIEIIDNEIRSLTSNLELSAPSTGSVRVKDVLELLPPPYENDPNLIPNFPVAGIKLYTNAPSYGNSGLYFVNENDYNDELISKNRSILYSMIF